MGARQGGCAMEGWRARRSPCTRSKKIVSLQRKFPCRSPLDVRQAWPSRLALVSNLQALQKCRPRRARPTPPPRSQPAGFQTCGIRTRASVRSRMAGWMGHAGSLPSAQSILPSRWPAPAACSSRWAVDRQEHGLLRGQQRGSAAAGGEATCEVLFSVSVENRGFRPTYHV